MRGHGMVSRLPACLVTLILATGCAGGAPAAGTTAPDASTPPPAASHRSPLTPAPDPTPIATPAGTPGAPGAAGLVVRLTWASDEAVPLPGTTIVDDGRIIWLDDGEAGALVERRLTAAGLAWVRARLDETGLLHSTASYDAVLRPGAQPAPRGVTMYAFRLDLAGTRVTVTTGDPADLDPAMWDVPPAMTTLAGLARGLQDPEAWIDASMWAGPAGPFEAHAYLVTIDLAAGPPGFGRYPVHVDDVDWPFATAPEDLGGPYGQRGEVVPDQRCAVVSAEVAAALVAAEAAATADVAASSERDRDLAQWDADLGYRANTAQGNLIVRTRPLLPYQRDDCSDAFGW